MGALPLQGPEAGGGEEPGRRKGSLSAFCALLERAWRVAYKVRGRAERQGNVSWG